MSVSAADHAARAVGHAANASGHSVMSGLHALAASGQVTLQVSAVPLLTSAALGAVAGTVGEALIKAADAPIGTPLPISDETVSAGPPPDQAIGEQL